MQPHFQGGGAQNKLADRINAASQAVLTGKGDIRNALLSKEINVPSNPTFQQLSNAISNIQTKEYIVVFTDTLRGSFTLTGVPAYTSLIELDNCKIYSFTTPQSFTVTGTKEGFSNQSLLVSLTSENPKQIVTFDFNKYPIVKLFESDYSSLFKVVGSNVNTYTDLRFTPANALQKAILLGTEREDGTYPKLYIYNYVSKAVTFKSNLSNGSYDNIGCSIDEDEKKAYIIYPYSTTHFFVYVVDLVNGNVINYNPYSYESLGIKYPGSTVSMGEDMYFYLKGAIPGKNGDLLISVSYYQDPEHSRYHYGILLLNLKTVTVKSFRYEEDNEIQYDFNITNQRYKVGTYYGGKYYYINYNSTYKIKTVDELTLTFTTLYEISYYLDGSTMSFYKNNKIYWYNINFGFKVYAINSQDNRPYSPFVSGTSSGSSLKGFILIYDLITKRVRISKPFIIPSDKNLINELSFIDMGENIGIIFQKVQRGYGSTHGYDMYVNLLTVYPHQYEDMI